MTRTRRRHPVRRAILLVVAIGVVVAVAVLVWRFVGFEEDQVEAATFYELPDELPTGDPGELIASEPLEGAPLGSTAWRIMYHSTDDAGGDIPVTGIVIAPADAAADAPVIAWAHPTTGAAPDCAPSRMLDPFLLVEGLHGFLAEGFVVVATDYAGMGVDTPSAYLIGEIAAHAVLDSVRATRALPGSPAGDRVVLWGHSQGGQAALFAEQLATDYAPDLDVLGVAVAAPAADLATLLDDDIGDISGVSIGSYAFTAYADHYGSDIASILDPDAVPVVAQMADLCLTDSKLHELGRPLVGSFVSSDPATTAPWSDYLSRNTPDPAGGGRPLFVAQGTADELVHPAATAQFVAAACDSGRSVTSVLLPGVNHGFAGTLAEPDLFPWVGDLVVGAALPTRGC